MNDFGNRRFLSAHANDGAFGYVLKFTNISWPRVHYQFVEILLRELWDFTFVSGSQLFGEVLK